MKMTKKELKKFLNRYWKAIIIVPLFILGAFVNWQEVLCVMAAILVADYFLGAELTPKRRKKVFKKLREAAQAVRQIEKEMIENDK